MKKFKAILALVLVACLFVTLFAACAQNEEKPNTDKPADSQTNNDKPADTNEDKPADNDEPVDVEDEALLPFEEEIELKIVLYDMRSTGGDYGQPVAEYANSITKETLNVVADYYWVGPGDWKSKVDVAISGGERFDVMNLSPMSRVTALYPQGLLTDISEYINDYAPGALELTKDYIGAYSFDGGVYGFPTVRNYCKNGYIIFRTDVLEEMGLVEEAKAMKSWSDYEAILDKLLAEYGDTYFGNGLCSTNGADNHIAGDNFSDAFPIDNMGESTGMLYADQDTGKVVMTVKHENYLFYLNKMKSWNDKGYIWPDSAISTEVADDIMRQGLTLSNVTGSEHGVEVTKEASFGFDLTAVQYVTGMVKTMQPVFTGIAVPVTCEEPEAAVAWINELYTNADLQMALIYGIPEEDYVIENGEVVRLKEQGYINVDFVLGNSLLLTPLKGNGADFYEKVGEINATAAKSKYLGFIVNTGGMDNWISSISAVTDQYSDTLTYGGYTEALYNEYVAKLDAAGLEDYAAAVQEQLDAWVAANK